MTSDRDIALKIKSWWTEGEDRDFILQKAIAYNAAMNGKGLSNESIEAHVDHITSLSPIEWARDKADTKPVRRITTDPGYIPKELLSMPGFVNDLKTHTLNTSVYPNPAMAFSAALAYHSFQVSRKVTDRLGTTTNVYILGLASSGAGKNRGREVNKELAEHVDLMRHMGEQFASSEGIEDAMEHRKVMLYQNDEFDQFLTSTSNAKDSRMNNIVGMLMRFYSEAKSTYTMRHLAKDKEVRTIHRPSLTLFGTAIPSFFYASITEQMLVNGFFARNWIVEGEFNRVFNADVNIVDIPKDIIDVADFWKRKGEENQINTKPEPIVVGHNDDAWKVLLEMQTEIDARYDEASKFGSEMGMSVWGRAFEGMNKHALLGATSRDYTNLIITQQDVENAYGFVSHQTSRNLYMASKFVHVSKTDRDVSKAIEHLSKNDNFIRRNVLMQKLSLNARDMNDLMNTMLDMRLIQVDVSKQDGSKKMTKYINYIGE